MPRIHQFHPSLAPGDAVSNHVFALRGLFRSLGYESDAYAIEAKKGVEDVLPYRRLFRAVAPEDLLLLHFSIGNEVFTPLANIAARKVLVYHNVTPPEFFAGITPYVALFAERGLRQLATLAPHVDLAVGVSEFNRRALADAGFGRTAVMPVLVDWRVYDVAPDPSVVSNWSDGGTKLLFVGRISPNKRQDQLVRLLAYYRRCIEPEARLILVGSHRDQPEYHFRITELARALGLGDAVTFTGGVTLAELIAYYRVASAFVSVSQHEGFGVPLLEAMRFDVPVVAQDTSAIGETLDGAGVLVKDADLPAIAEATALVLEKPDVRARILAGQRLRFGDFAYDRIAARTREVLGL
jgi:glycosyltransferase involved in cell wall biosynthesis